MTRPELRPTIGHRITRLMISARRGRDDRRTDLDVVVCRSCDVVLATVRRGAEAYCKRCHQWSGGERARPMAVAAGAKGRMV